MRLQLSKSRSLYILIYIFVPSVFFADDPMKNRWYLNRPVKKLKVTTTPGQSGPINNWYQGILNTPKVSWIKNSAPNSVLYVYIHSFFIENIS